MGGLVVIASVLESHDVASPTNHPRAREPVGQIAIRLDVGSNGSRGAQISRRRLSLSAGPLPIHPEQPPAVWYSLQREVAKFCETELGPGNELFDRARHTDLGSVSLTHHPRTDVHRESRQVVSSDLALAGVYPDPDFDAERLDSIDDRLCTPDGSCRSVECSKKPVARVFHLTPHELRQLLANYFIVRVEERSPSMISIRRCSFR